MIADQLRAYCDCVEVNDKDVIELINLISLATCWVRELPKPGEDCVTFLKGERREVVDLPSCADCPITFEPFYRPFDVNTFKFYLIKQEGIEETLTEITEWKYHESDKMFHIDLGLPACKCKCDPCGCKPKYKLLAVYEAGYEDLPECILPVFCDLLEVIRAKNTCECCNECECETPTTDEYTVGDVVSADLQTDLGKLLIENYKAQIGMISLCRMDSLWGFVV